MHKKVWAANAGTLVVVVTRPLPRDGGMAEDHKAIEAEQLHRTWTRDCKESCQRASSSVRSWTKQNETRGVLGRVSAGAAGIALDSANPRKVRTSWQKVVSIAAKTRESTASETREHKFLSGNRGNLCVNEFR